MLSDVCIAWNMTPQVQNFHPHFLTLEIMPRIHGSIDKRSRPSKRQHLIIVAYESTAQSSAQELIRRIYLPSEGNTTALIYF